MKKTILGLTILMCFSCIGNHENIITKEEYLDDFLYLLDRLERIHPNIYYSTPKNEFQLEVENIKSKIDQGISKIDFYLSINAMVAKINDAHTGVELPVDEFLYQLEHNNKRVFPIQVKIIDTTLYVIEDFSREKQIEYGAEILSINGLSSRNIIDSLSSYTSGERLEWKRASLAHYFHVYYHYVFGFKNKYSIEFKNPDKHQVIVKYKGLGTKELKRINERDNTIELPVTEKLYCELDSSFAILEMRTFNYNDKDNFRTQMDSLFSILNNRQFPNLIIDISNNGGGNTDYLELLLNYITEKPYKLFDSTIVKISPATKSEYSVKFSKYPERIQKWYYYEKKNIILPEDTPYKYKGNLYLITGTGTFSTAADFASIFRCYKYGEIIGEETGGLTVSNGDIRPYYLSNTKMNFWISTKYYFNPCGKEDNRGVLPDYQLKKTFEDEMDNKNYYLKVIQLIKRESELLATTWYSQQ